MIKVKDGYAKLIGTTYQGSATQVLLSNGGNLEFSSATKANTLVQRNASQHIYATYFNSAISDEALTDIGSVYVRNTSDTFIRRISKTQFYSIIDNKFVTLDTAQTITGVKTFTAGPIIANNASISQNQNSTSNYTTAIRWLKGGASQGTYNPSIGQHNTGGGGNGSICILPYPTETSPWGGTVGLFISKGVLKLDGQNVIHSGNYDQYFGYIGTTKVQKTSATQALTGIASINGRLTINAESDQTRLGFGGVHTVVFGEAGYAHRGYYFRPAYSASGATQTAVYIQNASAATSPTWTTTHTFSANGNATHAGAVIVGGNRYWTAEAYGLQLNNSDIVGANGIYFADLVDGAGEGIHFYRSATTWDTLAAANGLLYFSPNRATATHTLTPLFSSLANSENKISITVGGQNRTLTVAYASNAGTLGGQSETAFYRTRGNYGTIASSIPTTAELATNNGLNGSWIVSYTGASGHLMQFNAGGGSTRYVQLYSHYNSSLYWRNSTDSTLSSKPWKTIVDSANYTGIVLKIGIATKGSTGLPIYLNAGVPTACNSTLTVSITGNAATATKLQTARTINGTSFDGTINITTVKWGVARTITLSGAVTGSASVDGSQNVTIATTYQTGSIDGRYVGGKKTAGHGSSGTAYTADTYSSNFVNNAFVAYAERGSWAYANNGYVSTDVGVNIPLAGTAIFQWGASHTNKTQLYITPYNNSGVSNPAANEMLFYTSNGSGYTSAWTRVLTHRNYTAYTVTKTGGGASGTWGISITGSAPWANITGKPGLLTLAGITSLTNKNLNYATYNFGGTNKGDDPAQLNVPANYGMYLSLAASNINQGGQIFFNTVPGTTGTLYFRTRNAGNSNTVDTWKPWKTVLDSSNYTAYFNPANYVTALGTNGNYVTWTKNGATNNLTVPYATKANRLTLVSCYNGTINNDLWSSIKTTNNTYIGTATIYEVYNDGGPTTYGEVLDIVSMHSNHWQPQLWFDSGKTGSIRHRNKNYNNNTWGSWYVLLDNNNYASVLDGRYVTSLGTNGNYLTWVKNGSTNNITVPYATTSAYLTNGFSAAFVNKWDCNAPDRVVYSDYGSSGRSVTNAPSGWNYGTLLELGHINYRGLNGTLNIQLMWDVAHNTTSPGTLWFRGKDSVKGWAKSWAKVITDQNISSILSNYYTKSESDGKYVTLTTAQTISGSKTFTTGIKFSVNNNGDANLGAGDGFKLFYNNTSGSNFPGSYYNVASFMTGYTGFQLACYGGADQALKYRHRQDNGTWHPWLTLAFTSQLKDPVNYYWANIKVSASSSTGTSPTFSTAYTSNWFRSTGSTGWYSETYGGGWHMTDTTYIRAYNNKRVYNANTSQYAFYTSGGMTATGGFWHSAVNSNSYVLLAGGSYKGLGDFAKGNAGSATKGVYVTGGTVTAMTYSLSSNLNSGTSGKLAYYSAATTVASYTSTVGATNRGIYMNAGVPSVMTYYLNATVNSGTSGKLAYYSAANALSSYTPNIGSAYQPVYINAGTPGVCSYSFLGSYSQPIVLVSGYFYRSSTNSNSWHYQGYKHSQIGSPTFYLNGGVMRLAFSNSSSSVSFISATAQGRRNFAGSGTSITQPYDGSSGDYSWRSEGAYWFNSYVMNNNNTSYLYVRAYRLAERNNDSWYSGGNCWRNEEDAIESVAFTIFGYIYP